MPPYPFVSQALLYDVFNGDADGICALLQLRLEADEPAARLVSGVKRDIRLLEGIEVAPGDRLTVLDVSLDANRAGLERVLALGAEVHWFDHHYAGEMPQHDRLRACIDTSAQVCTSLLVDRHLGGALHTWAIVGAFGDALTETAARLAHEAGFDAQQTGQLRELGELLNYNAYGESVADLRYPPEALYRLLKYYRRPFTFIAESQAFRELREGYREDLRYAAELRPAHAGADGVVYMLPDTAWARRASGVFANRLAAAHPARAVAVLTARPAGGYVVSVRAPKTRPEGADALCRQFESGGGRKAAAGINHLPESEVNRFLAAFAAAGWAAG
ncbi:MAG: hypothetical protein LDL44_01215 [Caenispirillum sp.]|nr:hypothetical protein [Caenispirillum sp.]